MTYNNKLAIYLTIYDKRCFFSRMYIYLNYLRLLLYDFQDFSWATFLFNDKQFPFRTHLYLTSFWL